MSAFLLPAVALGGVLFMEMNRDKNEEGDELHQQPHHYRRKRYHEEMEEGAAVGCSSGMCPSSAPAYSPPQEAAVSYVQQSTLPPVRGGPGDGEPMGVVGVPRQTADQSLRSSIYAEYADLQYRGLDGKMHTAEYFMDHQNPAPFAKPKQEGFVANSESKAGLQLDAKTGDSRWRITKREMGPLFEPSMNAKNIYGAPSATNELQARMMESVSKRMDGVSPLGPGIHVGPGTQRNQIASSLGFNAANEFRDLNGGKGYLKTVDELRVKSKANLAHKEGLQGVAEMPHKVYNMEAGLREGSDKPKEIEISMDRLTATSTTAKKGYAYDMYTAGLESRRKTDDSSVEYFGASTAPHQFHNDVSKQHYEPSKRKGSENAPMYLGNATYVDQSGISDIHRSTASARPMNNRSFNEKYMDGTEGTFFGAATSMVQSAFVHFFGGDVVHTKKEERVGNPRPLYNVDNTQRLGGTVYDPQAYRDTVSFKEMNHYSYVGNPDRGQHGDGYLTMSVTEALRPREMQAYLDGEERLGNATAMASIPQLPFQESMQVPTNSALTKTAVDVISARGGIDGGNQAKLNTQGIQLGQATANRKEDHRRETTTYSSAPTMAWANTNMARHQLMGEQTKAQKENVKAVDQTWRHPSDDFKLVERFMSENPFLISRSHK